MVLGIGIDSIEIERFSLWANYPYNKLIKTFSPQEIIYCLSNKQKSAERFAARFAVREAIFKALSQVLPNTHIPFFTLCKNICVNRNKNGSPKLEVNWEKIFQKHDLEIYKHITILVSITHTKKIATAQALCIHTHETPT